MTPTTKATVAMTTEVYKIVNGIAPPIMNSPFSISLQQKQHQKFSRNLYRK